MTDRAYEPESENPFQQIIDLDRAERKAAAPPPAPSPAPAQISPDDAEEELRKLWNEPKIAAEANRPSALGAGIRGAERGVLPMLGGMAVVGAGVKAGAGLGLLGGPYAPFTVPIGGFVGGAAAMLGGSYAVSKAQEWGLSKMPESWKEALGQDDRQRQLDEQYQSTASFVGGVSPFFLTMRPDAGIKVVQRAFGGALMGGTELGQEAAFDDHVDWNKVAIATGFGVIMNRPTRFGERISSVGAKPMEAAIERVVPGFSTLLEAHDLKVLGAGNTREVFLGSHERNPAVARTAEEGARAEKEALGVPRPQESLHTFVRRTEPELFKVYDELLGRRAALQKVIDILPDATATKARLAETNAAIASAEPGIAAAYRRGAEAQGREIIEPAVPAGTAGAIPGEQVEGLWPMRAAARPAPPINTSYEVRSGAVASREPGGPIYIDPHIPEVSPILKDGQGNPVNLHRYLGIHEEVERGVLARLTAAKKAEVGRDLTTSEVKKIYDFSHEKYATPAERRAVEADGIDWKRYTAEMDGYLAKIESRGVKNPPPDPHIDPEIAISGHAQHHHSENKVDVEAAITPKPIAEQKAIISADVVKQAVAAGMDERKARATAAVVADFWETAAADLGGRAGTAEQMYLREAALVRQGIRKGTVSRETPPTSAPPPQPQPWWLEPEPAIKVPRPRSLLEWISARGGIDPNDPLIGDVRKAIGAQNKAIPRFRVLIRPGGQRLDKIREAATSPESKYLEGEATGGGGTRISDLLDAIGDELREMAAPGTGQRRYPIGEEAPVKPQDKGALEKQMNDALDTDLEKNGVRPTDITQGLRDRTIQIMREEGVYDPMEAFDRAALEEAQRGADSAEIKRIPEEIPGWDVTDVGRPISPPSGVAAEVARPEVAPVGEGVRRAGEGGGAAAGEVIPRLDPFEMAKRGELTADRAMEVSKRLRAEFTKMEDDLLGADADAWRKAHKLSDRYWDSGYQDAEARAQDKIIEDIEAKHPSGAIDRLYGKLTEELEAGRGHIDPDAWRNLARDLKNVEGDRADALQTVSFKLRRLPDAEKAFNDLDRENLSVIQHAMNEEALRGGEPEEFLKDAFAKSAREYGGGPDAREIVTDDMNKLSALMRKVGGEIRDLSVRATLVADKVGLTDPDVAWLPAHWFSKIFFQRKVREAGGLFAPRETVLLSPAEKTRLKELADKSMLEPLRGQEAVEFEELRAKNVAARVGTEAPARPPADIVATIRPAVDAITKEQGGISTVYIGDIVKRTGLPIRDVQDAVLQAARQGKATLAESSSVRALEVPGRKEAAIPTEDRPYHTVTFKKETATEAGLFAQREKEGQTELPGAGRITEAELAQRRANEPLKPKVAQKPMEEGLFGDESKQGTLFQKAEDIANAQIIIRPGRRSIIELFETQNASTLIHEYAHDMLLIRMRLAEHPAASDQMKADIKTTLNWLGVSGKEELKRRHHEKFATGFEQYLREGTAPSASLARVFAQFSEWLLKIYKTLKGLGEPINEDITAVFDRMLAREPERTRTVIEPEPFGGSSIQDEQERDVRLTRPADKEAAGDRVEAETLRAEAEMPLEVAREIDAEIAKYEAARGAEPGAEAPGRPSEPPEVERTGGEPGPLAAGGGGGGEPSPVVERGGGAETGGVRVPERTERAERAGEQPNARDTFESQPLAPRPRTLFGAEESPYLDKAGNIKRETLGTTDDVWSAVKAAADRNEDFIGNRQGRVTDRQVLDLADDIGMNGAESIVGKWVIGRALNAPEIVALGRLVKASGADVYAAFVKAAASGLPEDILAQAQAEARHDLIQGTLSGAIAESGRATRAIRLIKDNAGFKTADEIIKEATGMTLYQKWMTAQLGSKLDDPSKISKWLFQQKSRSFGGMMLEFWTNNLISGLATHMTYLVGTEFLTAEKIFLITPTAAAIGKVRAALGREGPTVRFGEMGAGLRGWGAGVAPAIRGVGQSLRTGMNVRLPGEEHQVTLPFQLPGELLTAPQADMNATFRQAAGEYYSMMRGMKDSLIATGQLVKAGGIEGAPMIGPALRAGAIPDIQIKGVTALPLGSIARAPSRMVAAIHTLHRVTNYSVAKAELDYRMARNEHPVDEVAFENRLAELRNNDKNTSAATAQATQLSLMGQGGDFMRRLSGWLSWTGDLPILGPTQPLKFIDPFVQIAGQVIKQSVGTQTPLGLLSAEVRADIMGRNGTLAQDMAQAKMLVGTTLGIVFGGLAAGGYLTGGGPTDRDAAATWKLVHRPYSVRIGDFYFNVHKLGPLGVLAGVAADMQGVAHLISEQDGQKAAAHFMHAIIHNFMEEGFLRGPSELIRAIEDSGRYGESYIRNFLSSFVPYSVGLGQMARAVDPYTRQARTIMDAIKAKIPYLSEELYPRRDVWGEPMVNPDALGGRGVTAIYISKMNKDPVNLAMIELGIGAAPVERSIVNVKLTDEQYDDYARLAGRMAKSRLDVIVRSADWKTWPAPARQMAIKSVVTAAREGARGLVMMKYPQIPHDATEAQKKKLTEPPRPIH